MRREIEFSQQHRNSIRNMIIIVAIGNFVLLGTGIFVKYCSVFIRKIPIYLLLITGILYGTCIAIYQIIILRKGAPAFVLDTEGLTICLGLKQHLLPWRDISTVKVGNRLTIVPNAEVTSEKPPHLPLSLKPFYQGKPIEIDNHSTISDSDLKALINIALSRGDFVTPVIKTRS